MRRETTNRIRFVLEELLPPIVRDSRAMRWLFRRHWGTLIDDLEDFRKHITRLTDEDYAAVYSRLPRVQTGTDNSRLCLERIAALVRPGDVCDVGCGTGYLLRYLIETLDPPARRLTGVEFQIDDALRETLQNVELREAKIEALPFPDGAFDTVISTHVLEHVLDIRHAIGELRRICRGRLIVVVPLERESSFAFNPHIHFFAYPHSFLRHIIPVPEAHHMEVIGRDLLYYEDRDAAHD